MPAANTRPHAVQSELEQTFERYPARWYENTRQLFVVTAGLAGALVVLHSQLALPASPGTEASILGAAVWLSIWFADLYTTGRIGEMKAEFDRRGLEAFGEEQNPLLPPYPTWRDLVRNWTNVASVALGVAIVCAPVLIVPAGVFRGGVVLANRRTLRRLKLALALNESGE